MANLIATINWQDRTVTFSGSGTFHAKDKIKSLGTAKWQPATKTWMLPLESCSEEQLGIEFPGIAIEHEAKDSESNHTPSSDLQIETITPQPVTEEGITVSTLIGRIRGALQRSFPTSVTVRGVLSKINHAERAGHYYLDLSDANDPKVTIYAIIWKGDVERVLGELKGAGFALEPDLEVMVEASVDLNPNRASISLVIKRFVVEFLIGKLEAQRDKTNKQLQKEKLFNKNKQLTLALLPKRLGLITSSGGTVINDFMASLDASSFGFQLYWYKANVQGQAATKDIIKGISTLEKIKELDAILIFRGGGSKAELSIFNDYQLARAICLSSVPVISAIGHQEDQSSVQDVSFKALGVPKDIGHFFAEIVRDVRAQFADFLESIVDSGQYQVESLDSEVSSLSTLISSRVDSTLIHCTEILEGLTNRLPMYAKAVVRRIEERTGDIGKPLPSLGHSLLRSAFNNLRFSAKAFVSQADFLHRTQLAQLRIADSIHREARGVVAQREAELNGLSRLVDASKPEHQLELGYTLISALGREGYITKSEQLDVDQEVKITFADGIREASIKK